MVCELIALPVSQPVCTINSIILGYCVRFAGPKLERFMRYQSGILNVETGKMFLNQVSISFIWIPGVAFGNLNNLGSNLQLIAEHSLNYLKFNSFYALL